MRIQFDPNQADQLDAVNAVVDLFAGQPLAQGETEITLSDPQGLEFSELGLANRLAIGWDRVRENLGKVQKRSERDSTGLPSDQAVFTVEMETGTGKTYVYLRTIFELNELYGWRKFIIVVPSVAIREGVLKSIELMRDHFKGLYGNVPFDTWIYDSAQASRLRSFATSNTLQILILNIQAFDKKAINVIHQESDRMSGFRPLEFVQQSRPVVILDEPQNMTSERRKEAIGSLNPLFEVRYSATHKELINLVYRLDPVQAYDLGLVKRIEVSSVQEEPDFNKPYLALKSVSMKPFRAMLELDVDGRSGPERKAVPIKDAEVDLHEITRREQYRDLIVTEIDAEAGSMSFSNGLRLVVGESVGAAKDDVMRVQIRETLRRHFAKERHIAALPETERMKVLSLFFIDRVANYAPADGKIRKWFVDEYERVAKEFGDVVALPAADVHSGYFAQDRDGAKDSSGNTKADDDAYELIMRDKERLLSADEPLRFIFSHSALREGWDNPNVFQICTLNETRSEMKKRQEIGRGLRLPVRVDGTRCMEASLNLLTVVANESYEEFARKLQGELRDDCGVEFGSRVRNARQRKTMKLKPGWNSDPAFMDLWAHIRPRTRYNIRFDTEELIARAAEVLADSPAIRKPVVAVRRGEIRLSSGGVVSEQRSASGAPSEDSGAPPMPDMLSYLQRATDLTRSTLAEVLVRSGRLADSHLNPQQLLSQAQAAIERVRDELLVRGIRYEQIGEVYDQDIFQNAETDPYEDRMLPVRNSIYEEIEWESATERTYAQNLDGREDTRLFIKLPRKFHVDTPLGTYNPDWAIVKQNGKWVFMVQETKGSTDPMQLRVGENAKIACGKRHFEALSVPFQAVSLADGV